MSTDTASSRRIVITGMGILSPLGIGADQFWNRLAAGESGVGPIGGMDYSAAPRNCGGEVREFTFEAARKQYLKPLRKSLKVMCREIQMGVASAGLALEHCGLDTDTIDHERFGVDFGANLMFSPPDVLSDACWNCVPDEAGAGFQHEQWGERGMSRMEPLWLLRYLPNMPACHIGIFADARGPSNSLTHDEASANLAIGEAYRVMARGRADVMIAGTTGTRLHPVKTLHAALWDDLAQGDDPPETWCRPFDQRRTGQVLAEGACSFILEEEQNARARGATIYGTILGSGSSCAIDEHGRAQTTTALALAMRSALRDAGLEPEAIGHINAHGLGSRLSDLAEGAAIREVFGPLAEKVPVTALKSALGNAGSGCGSLELAGSLLGLQHQVIPPTRNFEVPDPECPLNIVHGAPQSTGNPIVLNINVTRMGQASALIVSAT